jgi:hypothetical protein
VTTAGAVPDGPCPVHLAADGPLITLLSAHVLGDTGLRVTEYPAERRAVVHLGARRAESVNLFVGLPKLERLIDVLNTTYTRLACVPADRSVASGAA